jgi:hypothetical protein
MCTELIDDPQKRLTVMPATESGRSARRPMRRATKPCSPSEGATKDDILDILGLYTGTFDQAADDLSSQIVRADARKRALPAR